MLRFTRENLNLAFSDFNKPDKDTIIKVNASEETINFLNHEIKKGIVKTNALTMNKESAKNVNRLLSYTSNLERIADHAQNIAEHTSVCFERKLTFSDNGLIELNTIKDTISKCSLLFLINPIVPLSEKKKFIF